MFGIAPTCHPHNSRDFACKIPYRIALAGGWIDQPFCSRLNPDPPGSMVVVSILPDFPWMERSGIASGTRRVAMKLWPDGLPDEPHDSLVKQLYEAENKGKADPSGSQDMIGLIFPGINRLDYEASYQEGIFPASITSCQDEAVVKWLEDSLYVIPIGPRPEGYYPLDHKNLDPTWIARLGQSGRDCFQAIIDKNLSSLGASMNECMFCWEAILPGTVRHHTLKLDLMTIWEYYRNKYAGAMYSGCGGGYLFVASDEPVAEAFKFRIRV